MVWLGDRHIEFFLYHTQSLFRTVSSCHSWPYRDDHYQTILVLVGASSEQFFIFKMFIFVATWSCQSQKGRGYSSRGYDTSQGKGIGSYYLVLFCLYIIVNITLSTYLQPRHCKTECVANPLLEIIVNIAELLQKVEVVQYSHWWYSPQIWCLSEVFLTKMNTGS